MSPDCSNIRLCKLKECMPTTQKIENENKQKHNGRLNICDPVPK